jgi:hypothetical protein
MRKKRYYIAGPMTGHPQFNYPLFDSVATKLRGMGFDIVSPAELDDPSIRKVALASKDGAFDPEAFSGGTWADFLARDVKLIADDVDGVILLPEWETSRGARLEAFVALGCKHDMKKYTEKEDGHWCLSPIYPLEVMQAIVEAFGV